LHVLKKQSSTKEKIGKVGVPSIKKNPERKKMISLSRRGRKIQSEERLSKRNHEGERKSKAI